METVFILSFLIALAVLVALVIHLQRHFYLLQYLFFCRFPLLAALTLVVGLPWAMGGFAKGMIGNLAVLEPWGVFWVAFAATLVAWLIMFITAALLEWIPYSMRLGFHRGSGRDPGGPGALPWRVTDWLYRTTLGTRKAINYPRLILFGLLAQPLMGIVLWSSSDDAGSFWENGIAASLGIATAFALRVSGWHLLRLILRRLPALSDSDRAPEEEASRFLKRLAPQQIRTKALSKLSQLEPTTKQDFLGSSDCVTKPSRLGWTTLQGLGFFILVMVLYLVGYWWVYPDSTKALPPLPPLVLVLGLVTLLSLFSAVAALLLDKLRVGVVLLIVLAVLITYGIFGIDHYYEVARPSADSASDGPLTPDRVYQAWRKHHPPEAYPTMVVVTASGGGITAARWTAEVLAQLTEGVPDFADSVVLLSTVSGGGVGGMYFVDAYRGGRRPTAEALSQVRCHSGESSLLASVWGFAYRDLWWWLPWLDRSIDRGWALEQTWINRLSGKPPAAGVPTLWSWRADVLGAEKGRSTWRPVQVFNATIAETGERFLLSPMSYGDGGGRAETFLDVHPGLDVNVATAARLSAGFPYVSPIARPDRGTVSGDEKTAWHLADGGYFDNHGVVTAVDFLLDVVPNIEPKPRILFIWIRAAKEAPKEDPRAESPGRKGKSQRMSGFRIATLGPIDTLLNVRTATQVARNGVELQLLAEAWKGQVELATHVFHLGEEASLSWHLSQHERAMFGHEGSAWTSKHIEQLKSIRSFLEAGKDGIRTSESVESRDNNDYKEKEKPHAY